MAVKRTATRQGPIARAVAEALRNANVPASDKGAVALAKRYAALVDEGAVAATYLEPLRDISVAVIKADDPKAATALRKIEVALSAHSVASDLGPKLLAALKELGLTKAGRGASGGGPGVPVVDDELAKLRANARRRRGAG